MPKRTHALVTDRTKCVGCVTCTKACPTKAIRVRDGLASVDDELCIDCGTCMEVCPHGAVCPRTSSSADLRRFKRTVALPSLTLFAQFGKEFQPGQVLHALRRIGFDETYDISWMCEMVASATDAHLSESAGPWPKISVTCPAVVRLVQIRYPDLIPHLVPIETPRELAAKLRRRRVAADRGLDPGDIGMFFITPCTAIIHSIVSPLGLQASHLDGAFSIAELYGLLLKAMKEDPASDPVDAVSVRGLRWAMAGGEISLMRNTNSMTVRGVHDVVHVFDHIESGIFQNVDFIEAYICPDGCVSGGLTIAGRYAAQRNLQEAYRQLGDQASVKEEKVRSLLREHFFDFEAEIKARSVQPLAPDLRHAVELKREKDAIFEKLPHKDCAVCGAPDCDTFADDIVRGRAKISDCVFVRLASLANEVSKGKDP
jgi:iron only hydrogenase large subunit-like protein